MKLQLPLITDLKCIRKHPINIVPEEEYLFKHEYEKFFLGSKVTIYGNYQEYSDITKNKILLLMDNKTGRPNYFHWFCDFVQKLELLLLNIDIFKSYNIDILKYKLVIPEYYYRCKYVYQTLQYYPFDLLITKNANNNFSLFKNNDIDAIIKVPNITNSSGNYNDDLIKRIRNRLSNKKIEKPKDKIYLSRHPSRYRQLLNESIVQKILIDHGFIVVYTEEMNLDDQINLFSQCKYLIALHGAGLTNMLYMCPDTHVIEIRGSGDSHNNCYFTLASALDINYYYVEASKPSRSFNLGNYILDTNKLKSVLQMLPK